MGFVSFSIRDLYEQAFGYKSPAFELPQIPGTDGKIPDSGGSYSNRHPRISSVGAPYFSTDKLGREYYMPVLLGGVELPHPVISVHGRKNIVETPLVQRRGKVKELINTDDYVISIRGLIFNNTDEFPEKEVRDLKDLFELPESLVMESAITDIFLLQPDRKGYDKVVIKSFSFPEMRGIMNVRPYELELVSDEDFTLIEL